MSGITVKVTDKENVQRAIRRFMRLVDEAGILQEYKARAHFVSPSEENRARRKRSKFNQKLAMRRMRYGR